MTDEKKIEEQAPEQGEEKVEAVVLDENVLEQLLVGCIWDVLRRMHRVATKAITPDQATEEDDAIARHLARTLMGENPGFTSALPTMPRTSSPRRSTVPIRAPSWSTCAAPSCTASTTWSAR